MDVLGILLELLQLRNFIIFSLILQSALIILAPLRKNVSSPAVTTFLWIAYTAAGLAAVYTAGLVTTASVNPSQQPTNADLISLWSQFIILQVVGPDTITAFSIEDTNSWFRTSLRLLLASVALNRAMGVLYPRTRLLVAACFVGLACVWKFYETIHCLFLGNLTRFRTFTKQIHNPREDGDDSKVDLPAGSDFKLRDADVVKDAFGFFQTFKGIFANVVFSPPECSASCAYFLKRDAEDAFAVVETELNFAYDILYTKRLAVAWHFTRNFRLAMLLLEFAAFFIWVSADKSRFHKIDVRITYTLFLSALLFDVLFFLIHLLSNWTIASALLKRPTEQMSFWVRLISLKNKLGLLSRRWSGSIPRYSLIMWCTSKSTPNVEKLLGWFKIKNYIYNSRNMSPTPFYDNLRDLIFNELKAMHQSSGRGNWILRDHYHHNPILSTFAATWFAKDMEFDKTILLWHLATELCYYSCSFDTTDHEEKQQCECIKLISDYMAYILIRQPTMLSGVAGEAKETFQHTCNEAVKVLSVGDLEGSKGKEEKVEKACRVIMESLNHIRVVDDDQVKNSVLRDAHRLSKELEGMRDQGIKMWEVMSQVWVELLCYGACNCKASEHAAQLCKGGQLLTIVWLLTAHMGLSNRFERRN